MQRPLLDDVRYVQTVQLACKLHNRPLLQLSHIHAAVYDTSESRRIVLFDNATMHVVILTDRLAVHRSPKPRVP